MSHPKKLTAWVLIGSSTILILASVLFFFVLKESKSTDFIKQKVQPAPALVKVEERTPEFESGRELFRSDCNVCHRGKSIINPWSMQNGIIKEMGLDYFKKYLTKQDSLILVNDYYATTIKKDYGNLGNSHNFNYSQNDLDELIEFITTTK